MKLRTKGNPYVPYIVIGGVILLLIDIYLKLQSMGKTSHPSDPMAETARSVASTLMSDSSGVASSASSSTDMKGETKELSPPAQKTPVKAVLKMDTEGETAAKGECQEFILYYKPPKTGSTAVTDAARWWVATLGHSDYRCGMRSCGPYAEGVCSGKVEPRQLLGHLSSNYSVVDCLKKKNYYVVTSNREPMERWRSAYRYNIQHKATHYGIDWKVNYTEWMSRVPDCVLLNYYDDKGKRCGDDTDERIEKIVSMVDEVVDLYDDEHKGDMHKEIVPFLGESNVSDVGNRTLEYPELPPEIDARLNPERKLWRALKERSKQPPAVGRKLCVRDIKKEEEDVEG
eukprot:GFKZ01011755.1.p1 GENE.GFKZ01011755.1~~GFKZ01011755.1.p1  ORF type:complete len:343 (+),score=61.37 GFKZ01011755.1:102-1130(+)